MASQNFQNGGPLSPHEPNLTHARGEQGQSNKDLAFAVESHPLGVKPLGNGLTEESNAKDHAGYFAALSDELIFDILELLSPQGLSSVGQTCRFIYSFTFHEEIWKSLFLRSNTGSPLGWKGSWRSTVLSRSSSTQPLRSQNVFSDVLYRPFQCLKTPMKSFALGIPKINAVQRTKNVSSSEYSDNLAEKPFILQDYATKWPIFNMWTLDKLFPKYPDVPFRAEAVDWPLSVYQTYMYDNNDESPLYLFDRSFVEKTGIHVGEKENVGDYWPPACFGEDLFAVLGTDRPDSRWLIVGPTRSGSTFHKDPNGTSAWNAVIQGSKYWLMFPPSSNPPGVFVSSDGGEVTSPLSIAEYLLCFHEEARRTPGCIEAVCSAGEIVHIPSGWWHLVVNLEDTVALTQNFVAEKNLAKVSSFLKDKPDQISGFADSIQDPYNLFKERLVTKRPDLQDQMQTAKKRKWKELIDETEPGDLENSGSKQFTFGFLDNEDDEIP